MARSRARVQADCTAGTGAVKRSRTLQHGPCARPLASCGSDVEGTAHWTAALDDRG